jgi:hypothetical protein
MKPTYTTTTNTFGQEVIIQENPDGSIWSFMEDETNPIYQAYLRHLNGEEENGTIS